MSKLLAAANALNRLYQEKNGQTMDQMRMHKLLYFIQRESLIESDQPLFEEAFQGWRYGPVQPLIRSEYNKESSFDSENDTLTPDEMKLVEKIYHQYENTSTWTLSTLTHEEFSWNYARKGLEADENGTTDLPLDAIRIDAIREKMKRMSDGVS